MNLSDTSCYFLENEYRIFYAGDIIKDKSELDNITIRYTVTSLEMRLLMQMWCFIEINLSACIMSIKKVYKVQPVREKSTEFKG